jgi:serine/threonine-protein kinase
VNLQQLHASLADRYQIERELGAGGMATVYLAEDLKHRRKVAIKVLRADLGAAIRDRFPREIEIIAQMSHPHILPLHDSGEAGGLLYYVMPYVEGETLRQRLQREGPLQLAEATRILREVVDALAFAHQRGVVHRDIKPENIMLSGRHAIVMDFGVAKALSAAGGEQLTTVGLALGTPAYMAPEQAAGDTDLDHRADIYAVGVLAYEMLAGAPPFVKPTAQAVLSAHVLEAPVELADRRPDLPQQLADTVMRCLEKDRGERWQQAEAMLPVLEALGTPSGGMTPTDTRPIRTSKRRRRTLLPVAIGGGGLVALALVARLLLADDGAIRMIAVLPIRDISGQDSVFVDAMHDDLISALARLEVAGVVPRSAVVRFLSGASGTAEVARAVHADAVLESTVYRDGDRIRVNVQLVEPQRLRHVWAQSYERDVANVMTVQREVVELIASEIQATLQPAAAPDNRPRGPA